VGPLLALALQLTGKRAEAIAVDDGPSLEGKEWQEAPSPTEAPEAKERKLEERKAKEDYQAKLQSEGQWDHYKSITEDQLVAAPRLPQAPPRKVVLKTCRFHCCPNDGHTTHCFMYNDYDGIQGGVITCMFSNDRLPPGFKIKDEEDSEEAPKVQVAVDEVKQPDVPDDLDAAKKRIRSMHLEAAQLRADLENLQAKLTIAKGSPSPERDVSPTQRALEAQKRILFAHRDGREARQIVATAAGGALQRASSLHGRATPTARPMGMRTALMPASKAVSRDNGNATLGISALPRFNRIPKI